MCLIDAYLKGPYQVNNNEGYVLSTDHHALLALSTNGLVFIFSTLVMSKVGAHTLNPNNHQAFPVPKSVFRILGYKYVIF